MNVNDIFITDSLQITVFYEFVVFKTVSNPIKFFNKIKTFKTLSLKPINEAKL